MYQQRNSIWLEISDRQSSKFSMSRRMSFSSGGGGALRESSSRHNIRASSTPSRRQSFGGRQIDYQSDGELAKPDRRAMLDKWRREREDVTTVRMPTEVEHAPVPLLSSNTESRSALERFRDRKRKERQQDYVLPPTHPTATANRSTICYDDEEDYGRGGGGGTGGFVSSGTPSFSRRLGGSASKARRRSYSVGARGRNSMNLSQESEGTYQCYCT